MPNPLGSMSGSSVTKPPHEKLSIAPVYNHRSRAVASARRERVERLSVAFAGSSRRMIAWSRQVREATVALLNKQTIAMRCFRMKRLKISRMLD